MVEWWQVLLISIPGAVLGGLVVGGTALLVQHRQLHHERDMQAARLKAESENLSRERGRDLRRSELEPVLDLLREIDERLTGATWSDAIDAARKDIDKHRSETHLPKMTEEKWQRMKRSMMESIPSPQGELAPRLVGVLHRVRDHQIQTDLAIVVGLLTQTEEPIPSAISPTLARIHASLEQYVAGG